MNELAELIPDFSLDVKTTGTTFAIVRIARRLVGWANQREVIKQLGNVHDSLQSATGWGAGETINPKKGVVNPKTGFYLHAV